MCTHQIAIRAGGELWDTNPDARYQFESVRIDRNTSPPVLRPGTSNLVQLTAVARSSKPSRENDQDPSDTTP